ncbi:MAG TPA: hypothetical protein VEZ13_09585 [Brevibacillus sp.]|nr:hypothetical protein [Brevibacillus sp.]
MGKRSGGLGSLLGAALAASIPKAEPRPKAAHLDEVNQGWPLDCVFRLFHCVWVKIPNAFAFFPFFLWPAFLDPPASLFAGISWSFLPSFSTITV